MSEEELNDQSEESGQRFAIGLTPFGHIGINVSDNDGTQVSYVVSDVDEASRIAMHFMALTNMMIQNLYHQAIQEQMMAAKLMQNAKPELWTPNG